MNIIGYLISAMIGGAIGVVTMALVVVGKGRDYELRDDSEDNNGQN